MILLKVSVVVTIVAVGAGASPADVTWLWRRPMLMVRSLGAMYLLVPLVAFGLVLALPIEPGVKAAMLVLAVSSGAPMLPKKLRKLGNQEYIFSLLVTSSLAAIVAVPFWIAALGAYFQAAVALPPGTVSIAVAKAILLPLAIGMALHALFPLWSERLAERMIAIAGLVLAISGFMLLIVNWQLVSDMSWPAILALVALMICALTFGELLGGPARDDRTSLAIACATRHVGVAVVVAGEFVGIKTSVMIIAYFLTVIVVSSIYLTWRR
ncbi:Sodium Bile acid symporter family protein [Caballeronia hypogeia]|uniref:Sodium Bile acid symporter family protein n=2 Tax=Caballeronia hypogeia TaxID=1777140 RepID=A0A158CAU6_9BURK|nr:Sodium Bile acid symporter family protein [Caballeronia hypogeia]